eukprot:109286-Karenia_brevis.AAC.1
MDNLHHLDYLDGQPSPLGLPGRTPSPPGLLGWPPSPLGLYAWTTFTTWIIWMDDLHHLDNLAGQPSPPG